MTFNLPFCDRVKISELLAEHEVELASAAASPHLVETVCPVDAEEADYGEEHAYTGAGAALKVER